LDQAKEQLSRELRPLPTLKINPDLKDIDKVQYEDIELIGYDPAPAIKAPIAI
jgi:thymidylate synthase